MILFMLMPVQSGLLYLLWGNKRPVFGLRRRLERAGQAMDPTRRPDPAAEEQLEKADPRAAMTAKYLHDYAPAPVCSGTADILRRPSSERPGSLSQLRRFSLSRPAAA